MRMIMRFRFVFQSLINLRMTLSRIQARTIHSLIFKAPFTQNSRQSLSIKIPRHEMLDVRRCIPMHPSLSTMPSHQIAVLWKLLGVCILLQPRLELRVRINPPMLKGLVCKLQQSREGQPLRSIPSIRRSLLEVFLNPL